MNIKEMNSNVGVVSFVLPCNTSPCKHVAMIDLCCRALMTFLGVIVAIRVWGGRGVVYCSLLHSACYASSVVCWEFGKERCPHLYFYIQTVWEAIVVLSAHIINAVVKLQLVRCLCSGFNVIIKVTVWRKFMYFRFIDTSGLTSRGIVCGVVSIGWQVCMCSGQAKN